MNKYWNPSKYYNWQKIIGKTVKYDIKITFFFQLEMENDDVIEVYQEQTGGHYWRN